MDRLDDLPDGWRVWTAEPAGRVVLAYRPDVFDGSAFPAACLPTVTVAPGPGPDAPPERRAQSNRWYAAFYLEPDVRVRACDAIRDDRDGAVEAAVTITRSFVAGEVDYRGAYLRPRETYLGRLDELVGRGESAADRRDR